MFSKKFICPGGFSQVYIYPDGKVYFCQDCVMTKDAQIGNLYEQPFEEIWNSQKAAKIRKNILKGKYSYCLLCFCLSKSNYTLKMIPMKNIEYKVIQKNYPKMVSIGADSECNANCVMCRPSISRLNEEELKIHNERIEKLYIPILKDAEELTVSTTADPFASRNTRLLIKTAAEKYPNLKFNIITNGILCTQKTFDELGISGRTSRVMVSIHAATKETYNDIVKNGNFEKVIENISWLKNLNEQRVIKELLFAFVVSAKNYKEIPLFINFAKEYNAKALFWECREWDNNLCYADEALDITNSSHEKHQELIDILNSIKQDESFKQFSYSLRQLVK